MVFVGEGQVKILYLSIVGAGQGGMILYLSIRGAGQDPGGGLFS